ncbi:uncharacterized protein MYCFIDRAFT_60376 [Pseudocercospora fijiensis CIRAD86]|uniref:Cytochrome P450 monooxygenase n=1 Tax=Pseudocercospora fijiensis (strain CIRAD86) TaxID=383855 RepID=M3A5Z5_PSEFD|nr:uncharacterized protein MYCFIDRAFT_60376 [Pseudocercospora fijiensis CIRAD86]EME86539.1 hypothetical protein MYCFIDRAFT_60376 [Pseudocercospora fijiensis CIRAD86]
MWLLYLPTALIFAYFLYNRYFHPLHKIPGPFLASITPLWLVYQCYHRRRPRLDMELHKAYGSIVRISPNEIMFSNPDHFREVYGAGTKFTKSRFYEAPTDPVQEAGWEKLDMLVEKDIEKLRVQKRFAGPIYSISNALKHEHLIDNNILRSLQRFRTLSSSKSVDIYSEFEILNVDIMSEFTFGKAYGAVEKGSDDGHMASMDSMWAWWGWIGFLPWLNEIDKIYSPWASMIFGGSAEKKFPVFSYAISQITAYETASASGQKVPVPCLLDDLRTLSRTRPEFKDNWGMRLALTDLGAGVDTMSWTLSAFIVGIAQNPSVYQKLKSELDSSGLNSKDATPVPYETAASLPYFQACLHECQRMWPNIAVSIPRDVPAGGIEIDGYFIPEGYTVGMNSKVLGWSGEVFGREPERFRPERWLEADKAQRDSMENKNLSFGGSARKCPGMHVAWVCMSKVLASLYANFEVKLLNELDGKPGPAGHVWREHGSFPTKWHGLEVELIAR